MCRKADGVVATPDPDRLELVLLETARPGDVKHQNGDEDKLAVMSKCALLPLMCALKAKQKEKEKKACIFGVQTIGGMCRTSFVLAGQTHRYCPGCTMKINVMSMSHTDLWVYQELASFDLAGELSEAVIRNWLSMAAHLLTMAVD